MRGAQSLLFSVLGGWIGWAGRKEGGAEREGRSSEQEPAPCKRDNIPVN